LPEAVAGRRGHRRGHAALKNDVALAAQVGRRVFPEREASLIASLVQRDLPFYSTAISRVFVGHRGRRVRCRRVQPAAGVGVGTASPAVVMFCMVSAAAHGEFELRRPYHAVTLGRLRIPA
jgi:hypothetical protein